ncbi:WD40 repeat domain-containing protein [Nostoc flagelliforme]|nr:WD40 repeat domain-containing protein [Nostoc flagelliforme]
MSTQHQPENEHTPDERSRTVPQVLLQQLALFILTGIAALVAKGAYYQNQEAQAGTRIERIGVTALQNFQFLEIEALLAMQAGQELQEIVKDGCPLKKYPAASSEITLQTILDNIHEQNQLIGHKSSVNSASFSPDGKRIVTASDDNTAKVWETTGKLIVELTRRTGSVRSASFSPDGERIVTASGDKIARIWDITGKLIAELIGHNGSVVSASFSSDGKRIVTASSDNTARVWDTTGKLIAELIGHKSSVKSASFSPDGKHIVTANFDNTARVWNITGKLIAELIGHTDRVNSASFSSDGKHIVTTSSDNTARVWQIDDLEVLLSRGCQ